MINKLIFDEQSVTDPQEIADALNDHFCTIGERLSDKLPDYGNEYQKYITCNIRDLFAILHVDDNDSKSGTCLLIRLQDLIILDPSFYN